MLALGGRNPLGYYKDAAKSDATVRIIDGQRYSVPGDHARVATDGSIQLLGAGKSAVLEISYPLFVALFSVFLFQGQLQLPVVIGGAFIFIGAAIIVLAG